MKVCKLAECLNSFVNRAFRAPLITRGLVTGATLAAVVISTSSAVSAQGPSQGWAGSQSVVTGNAPWAQQNTLPPVVAGYSQQPQGPGQRLDQVPEPPRTGDEFRQVGPPLTVQSNALPEDLARQMLQPQIPAWCDPCPPSELIGCLPNGICFGGWAQLGYHNRPIPVFNNHPNSPRLHQFWLFSERRAARDCNWGWGYRVDTVYGVDAQDIQAFGNPPAGNPRGWDNNLDHGIYGWAVPQAYAELANYQWSVRAGKFLSPVNFEQVPAPQNFFYSHTYAFGLAHPMTMTGVISEFRARDNLAVYNGVTAGWDTGFERFENGLTYVGGFRLDLRDNACFSYMTSFGDTGYRGVGYLHSVALQLRPTEQVTFITQSDYLDVGDENAYSFTNYLLYAFHPCLAAGTRLEWYRSDQFTGEYRSTWGWTNGLNIKPHRNVMIRPETRIDWGQGAIDRGDLIFAVDAIVRF